MPGGSKTDLSPDFTAFYDATWSRTVACAYAITGDLVAAEDLAQEGARLLPGVAIGGTSQSSADQAVAPACHRQDSSV
ncbi:hypothetical protein MLP_39950 [Microlunatus phosphovorus NM-1]|uniref:Uncharacterized protein n=1 Tax=Microlunatus phosphovorus (strain ATCC 700054 / DSM 10555 / JCM 9379 / NBRC 101784 / NCIMB 13414 / VKM Ac-1990 / NM-1) TaxID=1032480 RepID=F5XQY7_MICPN|nr:hypothetical protein MLP_39950 [Microlunatus phosphovorus NM-1]